MSTKHVLYLDSVRGIACMLVVTMHLVMQMYPGILTSQYQGVSINYNNLLFYPPFSISVAGTASVCLFFVLSGFVLSQRFLGEAGVLWKIVEAIVKRPVRLVGVIFFTMLPMFSFLFASDFWQHRLWVDYDVYLRWFTGLIGNILTMRILTVDVARNPPLWTIGIELWGSFLTFGLCLLIGNWSKMIRLIVWISLIILLKDSYYTAFVFGILIADIHKNWNVDWFNKYKNALSYVGFIPAIILFSYPRYNPTYHYLGDIAFVQDGFLMLGAMLLFVCIMCNDRIKRLLEFKPLVFVGGISYSVYVLHILVLHRYVSQVVNYVHTNVSVNVYFTYASVMIVLFTIVLFVSWIVDLFVDKPCIKFAAWFGKRITKEIQERLEVLRNMITAPLWKMKGLV